MQNKKKSNAIAIQSLPNVDVVLTCLTLMDSIELQQKKGSYFGYIHTVLSEISNLDERQLGKITIQDAIALLVYYRMYFWGDMVVTESPALKPSDFIGSFDAELNKDSKTITIGDYRFNPFIKLKSAMEAENYCNTYGDIANLRFYVMGAGCTKSLKDGVDTIQSLMANSEDIGLLKQYDSLIEEVSNINLSLTQNNRISIICEHGGEQIALPFQGSLFLSFGL